MRYELQLELIERTDHDEDLEMRNATIIYTEDSVSDPDSTTSTTTTNKKFSKGVFRSAAFKFYSRYPDVCVKLLMQLDSLHSDALFLNLFFKTMCDHFLLFNTQLNIVVP